MGFGQVGWLKLSNGEIVRGSVVKSSRSGREKVRAVRGTEYRSRSLNWCCLENKVGEKIAAYVCTFFW